MCLAARSLPAVPVLVRVASGEGTASMARRAATKKAAPKRVAPRKARAKSAKPTPPEKVSVPYERSSGFTYLPATGALVRAEANSDSIVITYYVDELHPVRQIGTLTKAEKGIASYELGKLEEEHRRFMIAAVRMNSELAMTVAGLISDKVRTIRPELVATSEEKGKSKK